MGKAGRQEGFAEKEKDSDIYQEREVKHILPRMNTETHTKEMKYAVNGKFNLFREEHCSDWVESLHTLGRCQAS